MAASLTHRCPWPWGFLGESPWPRRHQLPAVDKELKRDGRRTLRTGLFGDHLKTAIRQPPHQAAFFVIADRAGLSADFGHPLDFFR